MTGAKNDLDEFLSQGDLIAAPQRGDLLQGTVIALDPSGLIIDLGLKRDGIVLKADLDKLPDQEGQFGVGDAISVMVVDPLDHDGNLQVSISQTRESGDWLEARQLLETDEIIHAKATDFNRGGLLVPFGRLSGFVPASHLSGIPRGLDDEGRQEYLRKLVGRELPFKIIEVDPQRRRLVFSERKAIRQWRQHKKSEIIATLKEGEVCKGIVTSLREFGAFVDIGGADGLIHISELSWTRVEDPSHIVQIGDEVDTLVIRLDREANRIGLSLKRLQSNPWDGIQDRFIEGDVVDGKVSCLSSSGVFVKIEDNLEGLLKNINGPDDLLPGTDVKIRLMSIDTEKERIDLELITSDE